jgi:hypothetical protein
MKNITKNTLIILTLTLALPLCAAERLRVTDDYYAWREFMLRQHDASTWTNLNATPPDAIVVTNWNAINPNIVNMTNDLPGTVMRIGLPWPSITYSNGCVTTDLGVTTTFSLLTTNTETQIITNQTSQRLEGRFWIEWVVETNTSPRVTMEYFFGPSLTNIYCGQVYGALTVTNMLWWRQPQPEPTEGTETYYVSSNLVFHVVWRGRTNSDCLESLPVRTEVRRWRITQQKEYLP